MADYETIKECFEELAAETKAALRGSYDEGMVARAERLLCTDKFRPSEGLLSFLKGMHAEVARLRQEDAGVADYFKREDKNRERQRTQRASKLKREKALRGEGEPPKRDERAPEEAERGAQKGQGCGVSARVGATVGKGRGGPGHPRGLGAGGG